MLCSMFARRSVKKQVNQGKKNVLDSNIHAIDTWKAAL